MVNFYRLLGLGVNAHPDVIAALIKSKRLQNQIPAEVLNQAELWLLQKDMRTRYNAKLKQQEPDFFKNTGVVASRLNATTSGISHQKISSYNSQVSTLKTNHIEPLPKRRKIGRWILLFAVLGMAWCGQQVWFSKPVFWESIGLEQLEEGHGWHQTEKAIYLTQDQENPQWLWVWDKQNGQLLMPAKDEGLLLCPNQTQPCQVRIQFDHGKPEFYSFKPMEHAWQVADAAGATDLGLRLQDAEKISVQIDDQSQPIVFVTKNFPNGFLIDTPSKPAP